MVVHWARPLLFYPVLAVSPVIVNRNNHRSVHLVSVTQDSLIFVIVHPFPFHLIFRHRYKVQAPILDQTQRDTRLAASSSAQLSTASASSSSRTRQATRRSRISLPCPMAATQMLARRAGT